MGLIVLFQFSGIKEHKIFVKRDLYSAKEPFEFKKSDDLSVLGRQIGITIDKDRQFLETLLPATPTVAFFQLLMAYI